VITIKKRRVEITIFEQERIVRETYAAHCDICHLPSEMLTPEQAGEIAQVHIENIYHWLAQGNVHGMKTPSGRDHICRNSLFPLRGGSFAQKV